MIRLIFYLFFIAFFMVGCDSQKKTIETKPVPEQKQVVNPDRDIALAGAINFDDEESLTIYAAILKNVVGDKPGAYIGHQMDKLANRIEADINFSDLLRAGEGLILEFNPESNFYFSNDEARLNESSLQTLDKIARILEEFSKINLIIESHTDNFRNDVSNKQLAIEQLSVVKKYLITNGIDANRIKTRALDVSQPRYEDEPSVNGQKNKWIDFGFYASDALKEEAKNMTE